MSTISASNLPLFSLFIILFFLEGGYDNVTKLALTSIFGFSYFTSSFWKSFGVFPVSGVKSESLEISAHNFLGCWINPGGGGVFSKGKGSSIGILGLLIND